MHRVVVYPNAKLNLGLYVTGKRADGFHDIETLFLPVMGLRDTLDIELGGGGTPFSLEILGNEQLAAESERDNLLFKAWQLLRPYVLPPLRVRLLKKIPMGAGLGGGSADASFFLRALSSFCEKRVSGDELFQMALSLGSDCPFFLLNTPAIGRGRGEILTPFPVREHLSGYYLVVLAPRVQISTAKAFGMVTPKKMNIELEDRLALPVSDWGRWLGNDFQPSVLSQTPEVQEALLWLQEQGAIYASLSGSGSAVFGLFRREIVSECRVCDRVYKGFLNWIERPMVAP